MTREMTQSNSGPFGISCVRLLHRAYKRCLSPLFGHACRFHPYCSDYALEAIEKHGYMRGCWLALWRLLRCNPWCEGGLDPVPDKEGTVNFK